MAIENIINNCSMPKAAAFSAGMPEFAKKKMNIVSLVPIPFMLIGSKSAKLAIAIIGTAINNFSFKPNDNPSRYIWLI